MHNHILSLSVVFCIVGGIFFFSSLVSERTKRFLMIEPLAAIVTTFGGMALVRYVSPDFSWLVIVSGASLFLCYGIMVGLMLYELWRYGRRE
jgi:ABC-type polysaccharide/polyol phosphate export permease